MKTLEGVEADNEEVRLVEADAETKAKTGLPPFEPFLELEDSYLKIRIAQLRMEAEDKVQARRAEFDL